MVVERINQKKFIKKELVDDVLEEYGLITSTEKVAKRNERLGVVIKKWMLEKLLLVLVLCF